MPPEKPSDGITRRSPSPSPPAGSSMEPLVSDPKRDATASVRGYVYQIYQSLLAWIRLPADGVLVLKGAEDFDVHAPAVTDSVQIKNTASNLTLRSQGRA